MAATGYETEAEQFGWSFVFAGHLPLDFPPTRAVAAAPWIAVPNFAAPEFNLNAILFMIPVAIAPAIEHVGDIIATSITAHPAASEDGGFISSSIRNETSEAPESVTGQ